MSVYKTITVKGLPVRNENVATAVAITPGYLIELIAAGTVQAHSTSGGVAEKMFALEDELQGKEIGDNYAVSTLIQHGIFRAGDEVYAKVTGSPAIGEKVCSNGDGTLREIVLDSSGVTVEDYPIGVAIEVVASGRQLIRIL